MKEKAEQSLKQFISKNQAIITIIGVFGALAEFTNSFVKIPQYTHYLSFFLLTLMIILFIELIKQFKGNKTDSLFLFQAVLSILVLVFVMYWFIDNADILYTLRYIFIAFLVGMSLIYILFRVLKIQKYFKKKHGN